MILLLAVVTRSLQFVVCLAWSGELAERRSLIRETRGITYVTVGAERVELLCILHAYGVRGDPIGLFVRSVTGRPRRGKVLNSGHFTKVINTHLSAREKTSRASV